MGVCVCVLEKIEKKKKGTGWAGQKLPNQRKKTEVGRDKERVLANRVKRER